jgi:hypothetical protein
MWWQLAGGLLAAALLAIVGMIFVLAIICGQIDRRFGDD